MQIQVTKSRVILPKDYVVNKGEYKVNPLEFTFSEEYTDDLVKKAIFVNDNEAIEQAIINNTCNIPHEMLDADVESFELRVYAYEVEDEELILRYSPTYAIVYLREGSYRGNTGSGEEITPTQFEQYEQALNDGLVEVSRVDIDVSKTGSTATVTITNKEGIEKSVNIEDGQKGDTGANGLDAKINGVNTLTIEAGTNITLDQEGSTLTINSTGGGSGGTSNYNALTNKPKINNVELNGNKTSSDLGLQPAGNYALESEIPTKTSDLTNDSGFIDKNVNNLTNYTLKTNTGSLIDLEINQSNYIVSLKLKDIDGNVISSDNIDLPLESVVVGGSYDATNKKIVLTLENGNTVDIPVGDLIAGLQTEITSSNKLASDLVDDTNNGNKFVTTTEKQTWNGKYDKPNGGIPKADLASAVQTSLNKADTAIQEHQDISGKANKISVVQTSASTIEINSNTFYKFGEVASLNITLASITDNTIYNEYMFEFVSGTTATTLTLPSSIKWLETPTIDANKIYQCSIVDNVGLLVGVANV